MWMNLVGSFCLCFLGYDYPRLVPGCTLQDTNKPVCYFVVSNEVKGNDSGTRASIREIRILINEVDFSEDILKALAKHFLEKYIEPDRIRVYVDTHISQMFSSYLSEGKGRKTSELHPYGGIYRKDGNEYIRFKLPDTDLKSIVLKGRDPGL